MWSPFRTETNVLYAPHPPAEQTRTDWYLFLQATGMNLYKSILQPELLPHYNEINETIRVIPAGKHITHENLEEKPVESVLESGYYVNEKGLVILKSPEFDQPAQ